jgi:hypothetical protein
MRDHRKLFAGEPVKAGFEIDRLPARTGLLYTPQLVGRDNDCDIFYDKIPTNLNITHEFSDDNARVLAEEVAKVPQNGLIVEVGVHKPQNGDRSSTMTTHRTKRTDVTYIGIDINDRLYLNEPAARFYILHTDSSNQFPLSLAMKLLGFKTIDLLFIDGLHSVNQVLRDWSYTNFLASKGVVLFHDVNYHPGPSVVFNAIDPAMYEKETYCFSADSTDWGIGVARRIGEQIER